MTVKSKSKTSLQLSGLESLVEKAVQRQIAPLRGQATNYMEQLEATRNSGISDMKGFGAAQVIRCLAAAKGSRLEAIVIAKQAYGPDSKVVKSLQAGTAEGGGFLLDSGFANEVIDLLRPMSVVRAIDPMIVRPTKGTMVFPKLTGSATAGYLGESSEIPASQQTFGQIVMTVKKLAALVPISNDLLLFSTSDTADDIIRQDLIEIIATTEDLALLYGDGTQNEPKGLFNWAASANKTASNGTTATQIESDFTDCIKALTTNNVRLRRPAWIMHPRSKVHLLNLRDANGNRIYPEISNQRPTVHGFPVFETTNVRSEEGGGSNESHLFLVEASEVMFGEVEAIELETSREGGYKIGSETVNAFNRDETLMRAILRHDLAVKHDVAIAVKTGITWGA